MDFRHIDCDSGADFPPTPFLCVKRRKERCVGRFADKSGTVMCFLYNYVKKSVYIGVTILKCNVCETILYTG